MGLTKYRKGPQRSITQGKSLELEHPQYFVDGRGSLQAKKGRKNFWGCCCGKWGIVLFGGKSVVRFAQKITLLLPR